MGLTAAQRLERRTYLGGTDMAALAGLSRWAAPIDVWVEKVDPVRPDRPTRMMAMGDMLEPVVADLFRAAALRHVSRPRVRARLEDGSAAALRDRQRPYLGGRPDRLADGWGDTWRGTRWVGETYVRGLLECKWGESRDEWGDPIADGRSTAMVPPGYRVQVLHYLGVTGREVGYLAVLLGYGDFRWYIIERDDEAIRTLRAIAEDFWHRHVLAQVPPEPDGSESYGRWLRGRIVTELGQSAVATPEQVLMARDLEAAQAVLLEHEAARDKLQQRLQRSMEKVAQLELPDGRRITWRPGTRNTTSWKAVAEGLAERQQRKLARLVGEHTTSSPTRPFLVPWATTRKEDKHDATAA